jgi:hypothetical protein
MCGTGVGGKYPLEAPGLGARGDPSRAQRLDDRALVVSINTGLMEGKKGRPDRSSAVYGQRGISINCHGNRIILGWLWAWVNARVRVGVR